MFSFAIMLDSEIQESLYTYPIAEIEDTIEILETVNDLNYRVQLRVDKNNYSIELIGEKRMYRLVQEAKDEIGGIYKLTKI